MFIDVRHGPVLYRQLGSHEDDRAFVCHAGRGDDVEFVAEKTGIKDHFNNVQQERNVGNG
jgi:hypothetical protein